MDKKVLKRSAVVFFLSVIGLTSGYLLAKDMFQEGKGIVEGISPIVMKKVDQGVEVADKIGKGFAETPTLPADEMPTMATENFKSITLSRIEPVVIKTPSGDEYGQIYFWLKFPEVKEEADGTSTHYITTRKVLLSGIVYDSEYVELISLALYGIYRDGDSVMFEYEEGEEESSEEVSGYILSDGITVQEYLLKKSQDPESPIYEKITLKNNFDGKYADRLKEILGSKKEEIPEMTEAVTITGTEAASETTDVTIETTVAETTAVVVEETTANITEGVPAEESSAAADDSA